MLPAAAGHKAWTTIVGQRRNIGIVDPRADRASTAGTPGTGGPRPLPRHAVRPGALSGGGCRTGAQRMGAVGGGTLVVPFLTLGCHADLLLARRGRQRSGPGAWLPGPGRRLPAAICPGAPQALRKAASSAISFYMASDLLTIRV